MRPQSRAVWQAAPDSRCPRRGRGPGSRIGLGQIRDHTGADAELHQHCRRAGRGCSDVVFESGHTGADEGPITLELMLNSISTADGQAGGALTWYSSRGTQGLVRARCRPVSPMQCKPASSFVQRDRAAPVPVLPRWLHRWLDTGAIPCWRCGATPLQPRPGPAGGPAAGLRAGGDRGAAARTRLLAPHWCCPCHQDAGATRTPGGGTRSSTGSQRGKGNEEGDWGRWPGRGRLRVRQTDDMTALSPSRGGVTAPVIWTVQSSNGPPQCPRATGR